MPPTGLPTSKSTAVGPARHRWRRWPTRCPAASSRLPSARRLTISRFERPRPRAPPPPFPGPPGSVRVRCRRRAFVSERLAHGLCERPRGEAVGDGARWIAAEAVVGLRRGVPEREVGVADALLDQEGGRNRDDLGAGRSDRVNDRLQHVGERERGRWADGVERSRVSAFEQLKDPARLVAGVDDLDLVATEVGGDDAPAVGNPVDPVGEAVGVVVGTDDVGGSNDECVGMPGWRPLARTAPSARRRSRHRPPRWSGRAAR